MGTSKSPATRLIAYVYRIEADFLALVVLYSGLARFCCLATLLAALAVAVAMSPPIPPAIRAMIQGEMELGYSNEAILAGGYDISL